MQEAINALVEYFKAELPKLSENYCWKVPPVPLIDSDLIGKEDYQSNILLKEHFNTQWKLAHNDDYRFRLVKSIVADWGGVKGNKEGTLREYVSTFQNENFETPLKGVASYSKILSIINLEKYAIYDARVAVALNAIQVNAGVESGLAFNYVPGRNNITGNIGNKKGFAHDARFTVANLVEKGWERVKRDETYQTYLDVLNACREQIPDYPLVDFEMVLFSSAEKVASEAMANSTDAPSKDVENTNEQNVSEIDDTREVFLAHIDIEDNLIVDLEEEFGEDSRSAFVEWLSDWMEQVEFYVDEEVSFYAKDSSGNPRKFDTLDEIGALWDDFYKDQSSIIIAMKLTPSDDIWNLDFLRVTQELAWDYIGFRIFGYREDVEAISSQAYESGEFDTGIEVCDDDEVDNYSTDDAIGFYGIDKSMFDVALYK